MVLQNPPPKESPEQKHTPTPLYIYVPGNEYAKPSLAKRLSMGVVTLLIILMMCAGLGGLNGLSWLRTYLEQGDIERVTETFMQHMEAGRIDHAYTLISEEGRHNIALRDLSRMLQGDNFALFEGYQDIQIRSLRIAWSGRRGVGLPDGRIATFTGDIRYDGDYTGRMQAILHHVDGRWKIFYFTINVPPEKISNRARVAA